MLRVDAKEYAAKVSRLQVVTADTRNLLRDIELIEGTRSWKIQYDAGKSKVGHNGRMKKEIII